VDKTGELQNVESRREAGLETGVAADCRARLRAFRAFRRAVELHNTGTLNVRVRPSRLGGDLVAEQTRWLVSAGLTGNWFTVNHPDKGWKKVGMRAPVSTTTGMQQEGAPPITRRGTISGTFGTLA